MAIQQDPDNLQDSASDDASQEVYINTAAKTLKLVAVGGISGAGQQSENGVTGKCVYSFLKEQWRNDPNTKNLAAFPFPMVPITDEFFELVDGWTWANATSSGLLRNCGWLVRNTSGNVTEHWAGIKSTGSTESNDQLYYQLFGASGDGSATNFAATGAVNQGVQIISDPNGDGNYADGFSRTSNIKVKNREYNQNYSIASTSANGESTLTAPKVFGLDASTSGDLNIEADDSTVSTTSPYNQIKTRFFSGAYSKDIDTAGTPRNFGIVVDVGTHSGIDGSMTASGNSLSSAAGTIPTDGTYDGGTLTVHEGTNKGTYTIGTIVSATAVPITTTFAATESNSSFTLQRSSPVVATAEQIYTKIQYDLRQNVDFDATSGTVLGKLSDQILTFIGSDLKAGALAPNNPNGGGSGVAIEGFSASDTNRITFYDNAATARNFPYVASLTINFGDNLKNDASAKYWVYFTTLPGAGNDFGESGALLIDDAAGTDMTGNVGGASSTTKSFAYSTNSQGGRTPGTDAAYTAIGIGLATGQYVKAVGTIAQSTTNSVSLVASLERQYSNPA